MISMDDRITISFFDKSDQKLYELNCLVSEKDNHKSNVGLIFFKDRSYEQTKSKVILIDGDNKITTDSKNAKMFIRIPKDIFQKIKGPTKVKLFKKVIEETPIEMPVEEPIEKEPVIVAPPIEEPKKLEPVIVEVPESEKLLIEVRKKRLELISKWIDSGTWPS